jgi:predicted SprT family Zn-dependent metalloprotease
MPFFLRRSAERTQTAPQRTQSHTLPSKAPHLREQPSAEFLQFQGYLKALTRYEAPEEHFEKHDLRNDFFWLFRLDQLIAMAYRTFDRLNEFHFSGKLPRPQIVFSRRATGGYYDHRKHIIGISIAMTVECGEPEFFETLLHEIAHIEVRSHSSRFYEVLHRIGGTGRKAPRTKLLELKQKSNALKRYPIRVACPNCGLEGRYRTRAALRYACRACCAKHSGGKFDTRFLLKQLS